MDSSGTFCVLKSEFLALSLILWMGSLSAFAQEGYFGPVVLGPHIVGYQDTVLYNLAVQYDQYGYSGPAPLFISTWFPTERIGGQQGAAAGAEPGLDRAGEDQSCALLFVAPGRSAGRSGQADG